MNIAESFQVFISFFNSTSFFYLHKTEQLTKDSVSIDPKPKIFRSQQFPPVVEWAIPTVQFGPKIVFSAYDYVNLLIPNFRYRITIHLLNDFWSDKIRKSSEIWVV